jgi:predicted PurR-regulated permease PerM
VLLFVQLRSLAHDVVTDESVRAGLREHLASLDLWLQENLGDRWTLELANLADLTVLQGMARDFLTAHGEEVQEAGAQGVRAVGATFGFLKSLLGRVLGIAGLFVLVPLYTYYLLFELARMHAFVKSYLPRRDREHLARVFELIGEVISNFFRGRLTVCALKGTVLSVGLLAAGVPYAFLFGMLSGALSLVPFFGPFLGFVGALLVALVDYDVVEALLRTGIVFVVAELIEGYVLIPKILGDSLGLHPVVVLFALFAGGASLGTLGILIALPLAASLVILVREFVLPALKKSVNE